MPNITDLDWLNLNSLRKYPIFENATCTDNLGVFQIPNDFIVDCQIAASYDPSVQVCISAISNYVDNIVIQISDGSSVLMGTFVIPVAAFTQFSNYYIAPTEAYVGTNAVITVNSLNTILTYPTGTYYFSLANSLFEMRTVIPALSGITRMTFSNADSTSFALTGDVNIEARTNVRFKLGSGNTVILDAGEGIGLNTQCANITNAIKTINGIGPDDDGNFTLDFSDCASLTPIPANTGLLLDDICCKPCTGCSDIANLTNKLMTYETQLVQLANYYTSLSQLFTNFETTVNFSCACPP